MDYANKFQYSKDFEILSFQVDPSGRLSWPALGDIFQEIAWKHADAHHFGKDLYEKGLYWVLSRFHIKVEKLPKWGDQVSVHTAGRGLDGLFALREFLMVADDGKTVLSRAMSSWILLDTKSRRPKRLGQTLPSPLFPAGAKLEWIPQKLEKPTWRGDGESFSVRYSDLDVNSHVNNVAYIRWIDDVCKSRGFSYSEMLINYLAETVLGQTVSVSTMEEGGKLMLNGSSDQLPVFLSTVSGTTEDND